MSGRKVNRFIAVPITVILLTTLFPAASSAETSRIFRYLVKPEYRPIQAHDVENFTNFSGNEGILRVRDDTGKTGLLHISGRLIAEPAYDWIDDYRDGYYRVLKNGKYGFIDSEGKEVIAPQFDLAEPFSEGLAKVRLDKKEGFIDKGTRPPSSQCGF